MCILLLFLLGQFSGPGRPEVRDQPGGCLHVSWKKLETPKLEVQHYSVECASAGFCNWHVMATHITGTSHVIRDMSPGDYTIRVVCHATDGQSIPGPASHPINVQDTGTYTSLYEIIACDFGPII